MAKRLLVVGTGPLLEPGATVFSGQCLRTWHFVAPLRAWGHDVRLMTVPIPGATIDDGRAFSEHPYRDFSYARLHTNDPARACPAVLEEIERYRPDTLIGINTYPAYLLAALERPEPFWADLNGWTMAEGLIRASAIGHDRDYGHFWRQEARILLRADRISTVSARQESATWGEFAMVGRLNHTNVSHPFTCVVPNAVYPDFASLTRNRAVRPDIIRGRVPEEAPICLWSGGFNSWTDVDALAWALGEAMKREPKLHFVATGGPIVGHDEVTYARFLAACEGRVPESRRHLLGWVEYESMLALHACAACGMNLDGENIETRFGARNRLTNMLGAGLPVITTRGTEISEWIAQNNAGETVAIGDREALADALARSAGESAAWEERARIARALACEEFGAARTVEPLRAWLENPQPSPDRLATARAEEGTSSTARLRASVAERLAEPIPFEAPAPGVPGSPVETPRSSGMWKAIRSLRGRK